MRLVSDAIFASVRREPSPRRAVTRACAMQCLTGFTELARDEDVWVARHDDAAIVSAPVMPT